MARRGHHVTGQWHKQPLENYTNNEVMLGKGIWLKALQSVIGDSLSYSDSNSHSLKCGYLTKQAKAFISELEV